MDEHTNTGSFSQNFNAALQRNGLPPVNYVPEPGTATEIVKLLTGSEGSESVTFRKPQVIKTNRQRTDSQSSSTIIRVRTMYGRDEEKNSG